MRRALALARRGEGATRPNPPVGAVVVRRGVCLGEGYHRKAGGPHAEVLAIQAVGKLARDATLYVTVEPCSTWGRTPPCTDAVIGGGVSRVVIGTRDPNPAHAGRGLTLLRRAGIQVGEGVCGEDARRLIAPFAKWIKTGRPYVTLKMGMSLDGRIADLNGKSRWITGEAARRQVRRLRAGADAVLIGRRTACRDNPSLLPTPGNRRLYRIIVDSSGQLPLGAAVLNDGHAAQTIIATPTRCPKARRNQYRGKGARVWVYKGVSGRVPLKEVLRAAGKAGLLQVLCEGGGELAADLIDAGLVDEYAFFVAPMMLGGKGVPVLGGKGWPLRNAPRLAFLGCERVGNDILLRAMPRE